MDTELNDYEIRWRDGLAILEVHNVTKAFKEMVESFAVECRYNNNFFRIVYDYIRYDFEVPEADYYDFCLDFMHYMFSY